LSLVLSPLAAPLQAWAAANTATHVSNNNTTATPIGTVEATGTILINGRATQGKNAVWDGELLQAAPGARASVKFEALGQLTLAGGSLVRVATAASENARRTLVTSVYSGQIELELKPAASAYLEAAGKAWLASSSTKLSLNVRDGAATLKTTQGQVGELGSFALSLPSLQSAKIAQSIAKPDLKAVERDSLLRSIKLVTNRGGGEAAQPVKLYANTKAGMIGMIDSSGTVKINGRDARRQELLWDGEVVQAPANAAAQVSLAGLGQVQLTKGSVVKLTTANASANGGRVLAASVLQGEINIKLQPEIAAYVEANGKAFSAEAGSRFRLSGRDSQAIVEVFQGNVHEIGSWLVELSTEVMDQAAHLNVGPRQYNIRPLAESNQPGSYLMNVRPHSTQQMRFLVTDMTGKPAPGVPVVFTLNAADGQPVGMLGTGTNAGKYFEAKTDTRGVAVVPFNAGSATGSTSLSAVVPGTNSANANVVVVDHDDDFWTKRNAIPVFAVAAGAIVAGIVVALNREDRLPIQGTGPTQIVP
jgi:hypothetical protein